MARIAKIVSDGKPGGTKVFLDDGSELEMITRATWGISANNNQIALVDLEFIGNKIDVELEGEIDPIELKGLSKVIAETLNKYEKDKCLPSGTIDTMTLRDRLYASIHTIFSKRDKDNS